MYNTVKHENDFRFVPRLIDTYRRNIGAGVRRC